MGRRVVLHKQKPFELQTPRGTINICCCGLSKTFPICDDSHKKTVGEDRDKVYEYLPDGTRCECPSNPDETKQSP